MISFLRCVSSELGFRNEFCEAMVSLKIRFSDNISELMWITAGEVIN